MYDKELVSGWLIAAVRYLGVGVLSIAWLAGITRLVDPGDVGGLLLIASLPALVVPVVNAGIPMGLTYALASGQLSGPLLAGWTRTVALRGAILLLAGASLLVLAVTRTVEIDRTWVWLGLFSIPGSFVVSVGSGFFQGARRFTSFALALAGPWMLTAMGTLVLVSLDLVTTVRLAAVLPIAHSLTAIGVLHALGSITRTDAAIPVLRIAGTLWGFSWRAYVSEALAAIRLRLDLFVVAFLLGPTAGGLFGVAIAFAGQLSVVSLAANQVLFPIVANRSGLGIARADASSATTSASRLTFITTLIGASAMALFARPGLNVLYGSEFLDSAVVVVAYLPGVLLLAVSRVLTADLFGRGEAGLVMRIGLISAVVGSALLVGLTALFGLLGAAIASSIAAAFNLLLRLRAFVRLSGEGVSAPFAFGSSDVRQIRASIRR